MNWNMNYDDEPILYTFYEYLLDKKIIDYKLRNSIIKSRELSYRYVYFYFKEYEIYCKDNGFKHETKDIFLI
ncbi:MAG: hypothetical protein RR189_03110 [Bacilli bacterium]